MENKTNLSHRIIWSFVLMTFFVSSIFALSIFFVVHQIEEHLLSAELNRTMDNLQNNGSLTFNNAQNNITRFYSDAPPNDLIPIPEKLKTLDLGFHEIIDGDEAYHILVRQLNNHRYILMQDQTNFEAREKTLYLVVIIGLLLSTIVAWMLGHLIAKRIIAPVIELSSQVNQKTSITDPPPLLAPNFPNDEVGQLAAAFDKTFGQLSEAIQRERLFTADVSHELRTPLMVISSSAELLLEDNNLPSHKKELLTRIEQAAKDMHSLVDIFLQLARKTSNENSTPLKTSNTLLKKSTLTDIAQSQIQYWQATAKKQDLNLQLIKENQVDQHENPALLTAVMSNLLRNALHYTHTGSVILRLTESGFSVEDTGPGIPSEQRKDVFLPFRRGSNTQSDGLGLGLSLVQRICDHEEWQIVLEENIPQGCCFRVTF